MRFSLAGRRERERITNPAATIAVWNSYCGFMKREAIQRRLVRGSLVALAAVGFAAIAYGIAHYPPNDEDLMKGYVEAFRKVWDHLDAVAARVEA